MNVIYARIRHDGANMPRNTKRSRILPDLHEIRDQLMEGWCHRAHRLQPRK